MCRLQEKCSLWSEEIWDFESYFCLLAEFRDKSLHLPCPASIPLYVRGGIKKIRSGKTNWLMSHAKLEWLRSTLSRVKGTEEGHDWLVMSATGMQGKQQNVCCLFPVPELGSRKQHGVIKKALSITKVFLTSHNHEHRHHQYCHPHISDKEIKELG